MAKVSSSPRKSKRKTSQKTKQTVYRVRNWSEYNQGLKQRGSLTFWFDEKVIKTWNYQGPKQRGAQYVYSDLAIQTSLIFRKLFDLPLRQTEGFITSLVELLKLTLDVPDYSTLCRRNRTLRIDLPTRKTNEPVFVVIDSTGAKVFGEGEWKVRQHGWSKRRTWRKLHLAVDEKTGEILAATLTPNSISDADQVEPLLEQIQRPVTAVAADGAYDRWGVYDVLQNPPNQDESIKPIIPPQKNAKIKQHGNSKLPLLPRDEAIRSIRRIGRKKWKEQNNYHRRSIAETAMARYKGINGVMLKARTEDRQQNEALLGCVLLNKFGAFAKPDSFKVEKPV